MEKPVQDVVWVPFVAIVALWAQLYHALVPIWEGGEYYGYGWFVPPIAAFFFWRRWQDLDRPQASPAAGWLSLALPALVLLPLVFFLRSLAAFDPSWRPPLLAHAALVVVVTHFLLARFLGWKVSAGFLPVTVYALSAVPYPWQVEQLLIGHLTDWVVWISCKVLNLIGTTTVASGIILTHGDVNVEVAEGCSGIRSLQSLVMASLFFGEMFRLSFGKRLVLLALGGLLAIVGNTCRAVVLAKIKFGQGIDAFESAHDMVGHISFVASAAVLFLTVRFLLDRSQPQDPAK